MASSALFMGWPETDYQHLLDQLEELESEYLTPNLVIRIEILIRDFLEQKFEFVRANKLPKTKFTDFVFGVYQKICDRMITIEEKGAKYLFWRICYLYIEGVNSFASRVYEWDNKAQ